MHVLHCRSDRPEFVQGLANFGAGHTDGEAVAYANPKHLPPVWLSAVQNREGNLIMSGLMCLLCHMYEDVADCNYSQHNGKRRKKRRMRKDFK